jgi:tRNA-specific 2-thiouridylase
MKKPEVRKIAERLGLATAQRKDSQGICFVGKVHLPTFLQQKLEAREGDIVEILDTKIYPEDNDGLPGTEVSEAMLKSISETFKYHSSSGVTIGKHSGAHFFTVGQRKGMNIGGHKEPLFVIGTDVTQNIVYVAEGQSHPGLYRKGLFISNDEIHWIRKDLEMLPGECRDYMVRIRYRQPLQKARLYRKSKGIFVIFNESQRGVAAGQFAVWYDGDEVLGSGVIGG